MDNFKQTVNHLKTQARNYLESHGYTFNSQGKCRCPIPGHVDENPSCGFVPGTGSTIMHCHACNQSFDVFHLANWLEQRPTHGEEWVRDTVEYLCKQLNVPFEEPQLSPQELYRYKVLRVYQDAANVLASFPIDDRIKERGWTEEICRRTNTGVVPSWDAFLEKMKKAGHRPTHLDDMYINPRIFSQHTIVFTWCNEWGDPVGFSARDTRYKDGDPKRPKNLSKYHNTAASVPTFRKRSLLYGLHWAKGKRPVIITEGFADVITPLMHGIDNIVALGGTAMTDEHVALLRKHDIDNVILALDGDKEGVENEVKHLDGPLSGKCGIKVRVLDLRKTMGECKEADIDNFFKQVPEPAEKWREACDAVEGAFKWRLHQFPKDSDMEEVAQKGIRLVVNEPSNIKREGMLKALAEYTGVDYNNLQKDLDQLTYAEEIRIRRKVDDLRTDLIRKVNNPDHNVAIEHIVEAGRVAAAIKTDFSADIHTKSETIQYMNALKGDLVAADGSLLGYDTGFERLNVTLSGIPRSGRQIGIAGEPSSGKTAFTHQLIWNILARNKDVLILLFTIDDNRQIVMPRFVSIDSGLHTNRILLPKSLDNEEMDKWKNSWAKLEYLISGYTFDIRDNSQGNTLEFLEGWIRYAQETCRNLYPGRRILVFLDNFHKLEGFGSDLRVKYKTASQTIHRLKTELNITFICTMELIKTYQNKPNWDHIAETKSLTYDFDALFLLANPLQRDPQSKFFWASEGERMPKVVLQTLKNKIRGLQYTLWYDLDPRNSQFRELSEADNPENVDRHAQELENFDHVKKGSKWGGY